MPWKSMDAEKHMKGLSPKEMENWAKIANSAMESCMAGGKGQSECEAMAIKMANAKARMAETERIEFLSPLLEAQVIDGEKGIYEVTLIKEGMSVDKRHYYPRQTLERAAGLFEGTQAFADHPTKSEMRDRPERSIRDLIGIYSDVKVVESNEGVKLRARLNTLESAGWVRPLLKMSIDNPALCGSSIHAEGSIRPKAKDGADLIESIDSVFSTDIVTKPNAGGKIERLIASNRGGEEMEIKDITIEQLTKDRPELIEAYKKDILETAAKETKRLVEEEAAKKGDKKDKIDLSESEEYKTLAASHEALVIKLKVGDSKLLEAVTDKGDRVKVEADLTESLKGKTEEEMDKIIESRKVMLRSLGVKIEGNPPKDVQESNGYHVGTLLTEAKAAYHEING